MRLILPWTENSVLTTTVRCPHEHWDRFWLLRSFLLFALAYPVYISNEGLDPQSSFCPKILSKAYLKQMWVISSLRQIKCRYFKFTVFTVQSSLCLLRQLNRKHFLRKPSEVRQWNMFQEVQFDYEGLSGTKTLHSRFFLMLQGRISLGSYNKNNHFI